MIATLLLLCLCLNAMIASCNGNDDDADVSEKNFRPEYCNLKKETGLCNKNLQRWYYDAKKGACIKFRYAGCHGNKNNFKSSDLCMIRCHLSKDGKKGE